MSIMMYMLRHLRRSTICHPKPTQLQGTQRPSSSDTKPKGSRLAAFKKKLQEIPFASEKLPPGREVAGIRKLDQKTLTHPKSFEYPVFPNNTNPVTGEIGGPRGPEPTRYGDWERKGRCSDF